MHMKPDGQERIVALEARISALTIVLSELVEAVDARLTGVKEDLAEALLVNESGACEAHAHPAGVEALRRFREAIWLDLRPR
jgi:hypothetical protein